MGYGETTNVANVFNALVFPIPYAQQAAPFLFALTKEVQTCKRRWGKLEQEWKGSRSS